MPSTFAIPGTLIDVLNSHAEIRPHDIAYIFLRDGDGDEQSITYGELQRRARHIAVQLQANEVGSGDRVLLLFPSGLDFIAGYLGCLYLGAVAVPAYPPLKDAGNLERIIADCSPRVILGDPAIKERVRTRFGNSEALVRTAWVSPANAVDTADIMPTPSRAPERRQLAMLQYTSGSTSAPKGVMLTHGNLMANLEAIRERFGAEPGAVAVSWLPLYHDMGLIGCVLGALYAGTRLVFMSPQEFVREPFKWLEAISRHRAKISGGPNFAYQLAIDRITPQQMATLDLGCWEVAFNGAEPIRAQVLESFAEKFHACRFNRASFLPCYGMAEASLLVSSIDRAELPRVRHVSKSALETGRAVAVGRASPDARSVVSCGRVIGGHLAVVVDPDTGATRIDGEVGELWISGASVTPGYWAERDHASSAASLKSHPDCRFIPTGDLGFVQDGHLYVTGRRKELIILRGRNYYPQDIEAVAAESDEALRVDGGAAFEIEGQHGAELVLVQELQRSALRAFDVEETAQRVRAAVVQHFQIELRTIVFVGPQRLPRTSSGKVQRAKARQMHLARAFETVGISEGTRRLEVAESAVHYAADNTAGREAAPSTPTENSLRNMVAGIMKLDPRLIACDKPLLSLDIDSLVQLELTHAVKVRHGYDVSVEQYFDGLSIRMLAAEIEKRPAAGGAGTDLSPAAACAARAGASGVSPNMEMPVQKRTIRRRNMGLSLMFFSSDGSGGHTGRYAPILECARQADRAGFDAIWLPERHFHRFGGLYPNPSVLAAAVATVTERIRIRAGSVIIPLHDPIRVAEEWSMVDNLSGGRVDLGFGQGWNPNDFVLAPDNFPKRLACLHEGIATVKSLWSGAQIERRNGVGKQNCIGIFPPPVQRQLDTWITCSGGRERFIEAGASGANILTAMLFQDRNELADKLAAYREARASHGYNPTTGHVTLMLHTYVGTDMNEVRQTVRAPLMRYLEDSIDLWRQNFDKLDHLRQDDRGRVLEFAFERYFRSHSMCGTPEHCRTMAADMRAIGVDEIACLIDFGVAERDMLASLDLLKQLNDALVDVSDSGQVLRKTA